MDVIEQEERAARIALERYYRDHFTRQALFDDAAVKIKDNRHPFSDRGLIKPRHQQLLLELLETARSGETNPEGFAGMDRFRVEATAKGYLAPLTDREVAALVKSEYRPATQPRREGQGFGGVHLPKGRHHTNFMPGETKTPLKAQGASGAFAKKWRAFTAKYFLSGDMLSTAWSEIDKQDHSESAVRGNIKRLSDKGSLGALFSCIHEHPQAFFDACERQIKTPIPKSERDPIIAALSAAINKIEQDVKAENQVIIH